MYIKPQLLYITRDHRRNAYCGGRTGQVARLAVTAQQTAKGYALAGAFRLFLLGARGESKFQSGQLEWTNRVIALPNVVVWNSYWG